LHLSSPPLKHYGDWLIAAERHFLRNLQNNLSQQY
jgi:hypothetical protein